MFVRAIGDVGENELTGTRGPTVRIDVTMELGAGSTDMIRGAKAKKRDGAGIDVEGGIGRWRHQTLRAIGRRYTVVGASGRYGVASDKGRLAGNRRFADPRFRIICFPVPVEAHGGWPVGHDRSIQRIGGIHLPAECQGCLYEAGANGAVRVGSIRVRELRRAGHSDRRDGHDRVLARQVTRRG